MGNCRMGLLAVISLALLLSGCQKADGPETWPAGIEQMEAVLEKNGISYQVGEEQEWEDRNILVIKDDNRFSVTYESAGIGKEREVIMHLFLLNEGLLSGIFVSEDQLSTYMKAAEDIYDSGNFSRIRSVLIEETGVNREKTGSAIQRAGRYHFQLFSQFDSAGKVVKTYTYRILNGESYEHYVTGQAQAFEEVMKSYGIPVEYSTVQEMKEENKASLCHKVEGQIQKIKEREEILHLKDELILYEGKLLTGELTDQTGSIPVLIYPTTFNSKELGEERQHYIYGIESGDEIQYLVFKSRLIP